MQLNPKETCPKVKVWFRSSHSVAWSYGNIEPAGCFLPPFCSSRALVSGEQFPSLMRYSWNSLKPMDWKIPCW